MTWTQEESVIVDELLQHLRGAPGLTDNALLDWYHTAGNPDCVPRLEVVWKRMQKWPHCVEIQAARGLTDKLDLYGRPFGQV